MDQPPAKTQLRGLKALVGILGLLIVLGTALVVEVIIHRLYDNPAARSNAAATGGMTVPTASALTLPAGSRIMGLAAAGGRIAVWVTGPPGDTLWLVEPESGSRVAVMTAPR